MNKSQRTRRQLLDELHELTVRMMEAEETLRAIRGGEVDGLVVSTAEGDRVFTLTGAEHPYRVMVENMSEGAVTLAHDGSILYCNQSFADIIHKSLEKVMGSSIYQYVSSTDLQLFKASVERGLTGSSKMELTLRTGGENPAPVLLSMSPFRRPDMPGSVCLVVTDLTEQKRNEEILAEEKLTTQILHQAAEIFVLCDHQGRIIRASHSTNRLFGYSPIGKTFDEAFQLLYPDGTPFVLLSAMIDNSLNAVEVTFTHGDNKLLFFLISGNEFITEKGVIGLIVVMVDVSIRKNIEEELRQAYGVLEQRVEERTSQLVSLNLSLKQEIAKSKISSEQLKESRARLRNLTNRLQQIREQERAHLSRELHDELGQVLTGLKMDVRWIERRLPEGCTLIAERCNSMLILIDTAILSVQRLSIALRPPALDDFGLGEVVEFLLIDFEKRTGIACELISSLESTVLSKEVSTEIFRIFQEALTNIARHAGAQKVKVILRHTGNRFTMEIGDDGRGITMTEITDPMSIGLTGMRERVYALEGTLEVNGVPGKGTTVTVGIPLHEDKGE
jgi:PAS domain S-box-containing protein